MPKKHKRTANRRRNRRLVVCLSDMHGGHKLGLCNPETVLHDEDHERNVTEYNPPLTAVQRYLWKLYIEHVEQVADLADGDDIVVIHNGDLTQGTKYPDHLVSSRQEDQQEIAFCNLLPLVSLPNVSTIRIIIGTAAHNMGEGSAEIAVTRRLQARYRKRNIAVLHHGLFDVDGVTFDVAHHGPFPGSRKWLEGNVARYYLWDYMMTELLAGRTPARILYRAHYHTWIPPETLRMEADGDEHISELALSPSYCGLGDHGRQATRSTHGQTHGLTVREIVDGQAVARHTFKRSLDVRTKEIL